MFVVFFAFFVLGVFGKDTKVGIKELKDFENLLVGSNLKLNSLCGSIGMRITGARATVGGCLKDVACTGQCTANVVVSKGDEKVRYMLVFK